MSFRSHLCYMKVNFIKNNLIKFSALRKWFSVKQLQMAFYVIALLLQYI